MIRDSVTDVEELKQKDSPLILDICPNPTITMLTIRASIQLHTIKIYDVLGNLVRTEAMTKPENTKAISVKNLSGGVYFVKTITEETESIRILIVTK